MFLFQIFFSEKIDNDRVEQDADESHNAEPRISAHNAKGQLEQIKQADWN